MAEFAAWGYSDDCAGIAGLDLSEYDVPQKRGAPYRLIVDGVEIGTCSMEYRDHGWVFKVVLDKGHTMVAKTTTPVVEED